jgi:hypothetical protein
MSCLYSLNPKSGSPQQVYRVAELYTLTDFAGDGLSPVPIELQISTMRHLKEEEKLRRSCVMPKWDTRCHFKRTFVSSLIFLECFEIEICSVPAYEVARPCRSFLRRVFLVVGYICSSTNQWS